MAKLETIMSSSGCYGCGACLNQCGCEAIIMTRNDHGFDHPQINKEKCVDCDLCYSVCPAVEENTEKLFSDGGPLAVYSIRHKDSNERKKSSSGGLFSALSDYALGQGGVVCGVAWKSNISVEHICALDFNDRERMKLSKYIQSDTNKCFYKIRDYLRSGKTVLFTGTPCQTAALKLFIDEGNCERLILCDVLCGGNVSPGLFSDYISYIEKMKKDRAVSVCFRTKKYGWKQHHIQIDLEHSTYEGARKDDEPFFTLYLKKYSIRESCFSCGFASVKRVSDITMGDFWGVDKADPEIDDDIGISLAMANTKKGVKVLNDISDQVFMEQRDIQLAIPKQLNLRTPPTPPKNRQNFWNDYCHKGGELVLKKYTTFGYKNRIKSSLSKFKRKLFA